MKDFWHFLLGEDPFKRDDRLLIPQMSIALPLFLGLGGWLFESGQFDFNYGDNA